MIGGECGVGNMLEAIGVTGTDTLGQAKVEGGDRMPKLKAFRFIN